MRIGIIGYGKMGKMIEQVARERNFQIAFIIDKQNGNENSFAGLNDADVAIEFTQASEAPGIINACFDSGIPVVSGTTGWNDQFDHVLELLKSKNGTLFHASNFSIGVNIVLKATRQLTQWAHLEHGYSVGIEETHHIHKLDAPSGTAISLAKEVLAISKNYQSWSLAPVSDPKTLPIHSIREAEVPGIHHVTFFSDVDQIRISHHAHSRLAFARGAVEAALFIVGKKGFYNMDDLLNS